VTPYLTLIAWLALPLTLLAVVDDWFLRPARRLAALPGEVVEPAWLRAVYAVLPLAIVGAVLRLLVSEEVDFNVVLVGVTGVSAVVWALDRWWLEPRRRRAAGDLGLDLEVVPVPVTVDYARSFLPVAALVLVIRAFVFEPFRIPSDSMMPTLLDGDFLLVNKWAYGLRLPITDTKVLQVGEPQRGEVVVFHFPPKPSINYIKRVVGLPGDRVQVHDDQLIINGQPVPLTEQGRYNDGCYLNMRIATEQLGSHRHQTLSCRTPGGLWAPPMASCPRRLQGSYQCDERDAGFAPDLNDTVQDLVVPAGQYLMIGDNRDNSSDGRVWGFVPEDHLVGRATVIWLHWNWHRAGGPLGWSRMGTRVQ
jgi:signal peptidase I